MVRVIRVALLIVGVLLLTSSTPQTYATYGKEWANPNSITYYINPLNSTGFTLAQIRGAIEPVAAAWCKGGQTEADCTITYAGTTGGSAFVNNGKNEVFFRTIDRGSIAAEVYRWWNGSNQIVDVDISFYDVSWRYFIGTGCSSGVYLEELAIHEFGHLFGLAHSTVTSPERATMYATISGYCTRTQLSLSADDIDGIEFLYAPTGTPPPPNTAPTVTISSPANNSSHADTDSISFAATATDTQDGTLSSSLRWTSQLVGEIGTGASFSRTLPVGVHTITAAVTDSGGLNGVATRTISVNTVSTNPTLAVQAYKVKGLQKADLTWANVSGGTVDVFRDGTKRTTISNSGAYTDPINAKGGGRTYVYKVCPAGVGVSSSMCSNSASAVF